MAGRGSPPNPASLGTRCIIRVRYMKKPTHGHGACTAQDTAGRIATAAGYGPEIPAADGKPLKPISVSGSIIPSVCRRFGARTLPGSYRRMNCPARYTFAGFNLPGSLLPSGHTGAHGIFVFRGAGIKVTAVPRKHPYSIARTAM